MCSWISAGDVALSISATSTATFSALGLMPLLLYLTGDLGERACALRAREQEELSWIMAGRPPRQQQPDS
jgi:hypothetical protein